MKSRRISPQNKANLERSTEWLEDVIRKMLVLHRQSTLPEASLSAVEKNELFKSDGDMPTFDPINRSCANLTGSGDLKLLQSRELKNAVADYYSTAEITTLVQATHEMILVQIFEPYIIENPEYSALRQDKVTDFPLAETIDQASIIEVVPTREFRNTVVQNGLSRLTFCISFGRRVAGMTKSCRCWTNQVQKPY